MAQQIHIVDTTLRDGSHAVSHSFSPDQVRKIASQLDQSGVYMIEVSHGDGISGSSYNYGFGKYPEMDLIAAAADVVKNAKLDILLIPGIGTVADLKRARALGVNAVRVATHVTEADVSAEHIRAAKELDMFAVGFLMMAHMAPPEKIAEQAKLMESYGADYINIADSAGYLLPVTVRGFFPGKDAVLPPKNDEGGWGMVAPIWILAALTLLLGLCAGSMLGAMESLTASLF